MIYETQYFKKNRSSHQRCSLEKGVLKKFTKFTGKHLCQTLFYNNRPEAGNFIIMETLAQVFSFYRTPPDDCFWKSLSILTQ